MELSTRTAYKNSQHAIYVSYICKYIANLVKMPLNVVFDVKIVNVNNGLCRSTDVLRSS